MLKRLNDSKIETDLLFLLTTNDGVDINLVLRSISNNRDRISTRELAMVSPEDTYMLLNFLEMRIFQKQNNFTKL